MTTDLDRFETALMGELRAAVAARAAHEAPVRPLSGAGPRRHGRVRLVGVAAAGAAAAVAFVALPGPAYSVTEGNDGRIVVSVKRLDDAAGLEQQLRAHGVAADVTFFTDARMCAEGRYVPVPRRTGILMSAGSDGAFSVTLDPGDVRDGETFVLSAANVVIPNGIKSSVSADVTAGPVAPCRPVPVDLPDVPRS